MKKITAYIQLVRPHQYVKNGLIWFPLFFGLKLQDLHSVYMTAYAFVAFCLAAGSIYIYNDMNDIAADRLHPVKKNRPLAKGVLTSFEALILFFVFLIACAVISFTFFTIKFYTIIGGYIVLNLAYSRFFKHIAILDVVCISMGFVLRIFAGGVAADIKLSPWIIIMTFLLALFLALAKRRDDLVLADQGHMTRKSLDGYSLDFVSLSMGIMASVTIVGYLLYTVSPEVTEKHGTDDLYLTVFWVIIGLLRYMQVTFVENNSGSPTQVLLKDVFLQIVIALWLITLYVLLYIKPF